VPKGPQSEALTLLLPYFKKHWVTVGVALVFSHPGGLRSLFIPILLGQAAECRPFCDGIMSDPADLSMRDLISGCSWPAIAFGPAGRRLRFYFVSSLRERVAADICAVTLCPSLKLSPAYHSRAGGGEMRSGEARVTLTADITDRDLLGPSASWPP